MSASVNERDLEIDRLNQTIKLADDMLSLETDKRFRDIFGEVFIEAFAITTTMQIASYDVPTRQRTIEKTLARSHFMQFIEGVKNDGIVAREQFAEVMAEPVEIEPEVD